MNRIGNVMRCAFIFHVFGFVAVAAAGGMAAETDDFAAEFRSTFADLAQVSKLLDSLGADSFATRDQAMSRLLAMPVQPTAAMKTIVNDQDPERRRRVAYVLKHGASDWNRVAAMVERVRNEKIGGCTAELLILVEYADSDQRSAIESALLASVTPEDIDELDAALGNKPVVVQRAAAAALLRVGDEASMNVLLAHQTRLDASVGIVLAEGLIKLRHLEGLALSVSLLECEDESVRTRAAILLQSSTGHDEGYFSAADREERSKVVDRWRNWLATRNDGFQLRPLESSLTEPNPFE